MRELDLYKVDIFCEMFNRRLKMDIDSYYFFQAVGDDISLNKVKKSIKNILLKASDNTKLRNAKISTLSYAFVNYNDEVNMRNKGYYTLKKYCNNKEIRSANLKKLLEDEGYLIKNYPTEKSFDNNLVFVTVNTYKNRKADIEKPELLIIWKEDFILNLINSNKEKIDEYILDYKYRIPRTRFENLNEILKYSKYISNLEFNNPDFNYNEKLEYCEKYPFIDIEINISDLKHSNYGFNFFIENLMKLIEYKESIITDGAKLHKLSIQKRILLKYIENYNKKYND